MTDTVARPVGDVPATVDALGFEPYAQSIAELIRAHQQAQPLAIGISAPWGSGKSTLMRLVQQRLAAAPGATSSPASGVSYAPIWLNMWRYHTSSALWPAMTRDIFGQALGQLSFFDRIRLRLAIGFRIDSFSLWRLIGPNWRIWLILTGLGVLAALSYGVAVLLKGGGDLGGAPRWQILATFTPVVLAGLAALIGFARSIIQPFSINLKKASEASSDDSNVGRSAEAEEDIHRMFSLLTRGETRGLVIFVDDLDRCQPPRVVEAVEAIHLLFAGMSDLIKNQDSFPRVVFIVGMDAEMISASIDVAYHDLVSELNDRNNPLGRNYGHRFLAKIVQWGFEIPTPSDANLNTFVNSVIGEVADGRSAAAGAADVERFEGDAPGPSQRRRR